MTAPQPLPIDAVLSDLLAVLAGAGRVVLQAPPGAGKTTRVPLALLPHVAGRILLLEPRRLAARAAAERMAGSLGEPVGRRVGYRIRGAAKVSAATRIEVVTEGILTRMIQSDPGLEGVGAVIFDEFHERALTADLGLALAWEARGALRPDLWLIVMSATLDAAPVAALLDDAPVVTARGTTHAVETRWRDRPLGPGARLDAEVATLVQTAVAADPGSVLAFLPGEREIRAVARLLDGRLPEDCVVRPLYGAMPLVAQRAAIAPAETGRKVVLATAIAETSLTIDGVRVVIDSGRARRARHDPASGMTRLVTERASRAEADQRRGRAGRIAPGICYRLWTRGEEGAMPAFAPPEIETADLAGLALELALWGNACGAGLAFLTPPPAGPLAEARALLTGLGALDAAGRITAHGRAMAALPLHPRLAHMLLTAGPQAAPLAALLEARDPLRGATVDLAQRLDLLAGRRGGADPAALDRLRTEASRLVRLASDPGTGSLSPGAMASLAYPDRIGLRRPGAAPRWLLAGGKGAHMAEDDPLAGARLLVATDLDGDAREARIRQAAVLEEAALEALHGARIRRARVCVWDARAGRVRARVETRLDALVLADAPWPDVPAEDRARAALEGVRRLGLDACGMTPAARRLQARIAFARARGTDLPDVSDAALLARADDWLLPFLGGIATAADLAALDLAGPLRDALDWGRQRTLDRLAPAEFVTPLGRRIPIDYDGGTPAIAVRMQEMFGVTSHPVAAGAPLRITLLSPARRPLQVTTDLPGFWAGAYAEVRKEMRGRYPRHPWPEDPTAADPTLRAKRRGN